MLGMTGWMCVVLLSVQAFAQYRLKENLFQVQNGVIVGNGLFENRPPGLRELEARRNEFSSPSEVLALLIKAQPKLAKNLVLLHHSESQQLSTPDHPRLIVFSGGIAYGFSEYPGQKNQRVEILEADPSSYKLTMGEVIFSPTGTTFESNPKSCTTCHGSPAKPLWNPYDFWPHAYGSAIGSYSSQEEEGAYDHFRALAQSSALMKQLVLPKKYKLDQDVESLTLFSSFINQINLGRWIHENLPIGKTLVGFERTLIAAASACSYNGNDRTDAEAERRLAELFAPTEMARLPLSFSEVSKDMQLGRKRFNDYLDRVLSRVFPTLTDLDRVDHDRLSVDTRLISQLIWIMSLSGLDTSNLSTNLHGSDVTLSQPTNFSIDFLTALFAIRPDLFHGLTVTGLDLGIGGGGDNWIRADCAQVKALSAADRRSVGPVTVQTYQQIKASRPPMSRCSKCHVDHLADQLRLAPNIPFDDPLKLASLLDDPVSNLRAKISERIRAVGTSEQMPPGKPLSSDEIEAFEDFLVNL